MPDIEPEATALLLFDVVEQYRPAIEAAGVLDPIRAVMDACRARGVPVLFARPDHRADGSDMATAPTDTDTAFQPWTEHHRPRAVPNTVAGSPESQVVAELAPLPDDYVIFKHRWSAFFQTPLELSLRTLGVTTVLVVGGSTHVGIASTVFAGRDLDFDMVVVRDGLTGLLEQREFFVEKVFPRMCRVRTSEEVIAALQSAVDGPSRD